tara:strand:- start:320 stop:1669 length:1350 start_codon:yes stop_codon:yes gene_type:complete
MISVGKKVKYPIQILFASLLFSLPAYPSTRYTVKDTKSNKYLFKRENVSCIEDNSDKTLDYCRANGVRTDLVNIKQAVSLTGKCGTVSSERIILSSKWFNVNPGDPSPDSENVVCSAARHFGLVRYPHNKFLSRYYKSAVEKINKKDYEGAINDLNKAINGNERNNADAYDYRGYAKYNLKNFEGALKDSNKAIELNTNHRYAYNNRGNAKTDLSDYKGAISDFTKSIEINPNSSNPYFMRGWIYGKQGNFSESIKDLTKAIELDERTAEAYFYRGGSMYSINSNRACDDWVKAYDLGYANAKEAINQYCSINNNDLNQNLPINYYESARKKRDSNDFKGAIKELDKAIQMKSNYDDAYYLRAMTKNQLKDYKGAIKDYNKTIELLPNFGDPYYLRGRAYFEIALTKNDKDFYNKGCRSILKAEELGSKEAMQVVKDGYCSEFIETKKK